MPLESVFMLHDRYKIEALLGHGGMGAVYRAFDTLLDSPCAIKEFRLGHLPTEEEIRYKDTADQTSPQSGSVVSVLTHEKAAEQFKREAKLLASLDHKNLPKVTDYFGVDNEYYLVMTLIEGKDLATIWENRGRKPLPEAYVLKWMEQVIDALVYCHSKGVIHRDVKPGNVIVTRSDKIYLVDFGIAKYVGGEQTSTSVTQVMTPGYSPPEQYAGAGRTDKRSDIYSLGATMYMLLTGKRPIESVVRVMGRELPPPRHVITKISPIVDQVIMRALSLQPADRYQSMDKVKEALKDIFDSKRQIPPSDIIDFISEEDKEKVPISSDNAVILDRPLDLQLHDININAAKEVEPPVFSPGEIQATPSVSSGALKDNILTEEVEIGSPEPEKAEQFETFLQDHQSAEPLKGTTKQLYVEDMEVLQEEAVLPAVEEAPESEPAIEVVEITENPAYPEIDELALPPVAEENLPSKEEAVVESDKEPTTPPSILELVVSPTTDLTKSLEYQVTAVPPGSKIRLMSGKYYLEHALFIEKSLHLIGVGMDETTIVCMEEGCVLKFNGNGSLSAQGITFQHEGGSWAHIMEISGGEVNISYCRFTGGVSSEKGHLGGSGLKLYGTTKGVIHHCEMTQNSYYGIEVAEEAQPTLRKNICRKNERSGLSYQREAGGVASENDCDFNKLNGIEVGGHAQPQLHDNTCQQNKMAGLIYYGTAAGIARENRCLENESHGILVGKRAQPSLEYNTCSRNRQVGIQYIEEASGIALGNRCESNRFHGICASGQAWPTIEANICRKNRQDGIIYLESTVGVIKDNHCEENGLHGIEITGQAKPQLETNACNYNYQVGIRFTGTSSGMAMGNLCEGNGLNGIEVTENSQPRLETNICRKNKQAGILYTGSSAGVARMNQSDDNELYGIGLGGQSRPTLKTNICRQNRQSGIFYTDQASGLAYGNQCLGNKYYGINICGYAQPQLEDCTCRENLKSGILYLDAASGLARKNICVQNKEYGIAILGKAKPVMKENSCSENGIGNVNFKL